ncbi:unnamed protein product [Discosporangium mesarthrocarpum]
MDLMSRMELLGVDVSSGMAWVGVLLGVSRMGRPEECIEILRHMEARALEGGVFGSGSSGEGLEDIRTIAHNHCMFAFLKAGRHAEAVRHFDRHFRRGQIPNPNPNRSSSTDPNPDPNPNPNTDPYANPNPKRGGAAATIMGVGSGSGLGLGLGEGGQSLGHPPPIPDIFSFTHLLGALEKGGHHQECLAALEEMRYRGIQPDTYTYASAMKAVGAKGMWTKALSLLSELKGMGVRPDVYVYTAALSACAAQGRWKEALTLGEDMKRGGVKPNAYTVTSTINALASGGQWKRAIQVLSVTLTLILSWQREGTLEVCFFFCSFVLYCDPIPNLNPNRSPYPKFLSSGLGRVLIFVVSCFFFSGLDLGLAIVFVGVRSTVRVKVRVRVVVRVRFRVRID